MHFFQRVILLVALAMSLPGCPRNGQADKVVPPAPTPPPQVLLPDIQPETDLPQFAKQTNEIEIADSFSEVDASWVIGSLVDRTTGAVYALDNYLLAGAKPVVMPKTEIVFKNFIENSVAANAKWLEFLNVKGDDTVRAEVSVTKTMAVSVDNQSVNSNLLKTQLAANKIRVADRDKYGVVVGYVEYVLTATYFRHSGVEANVSGYGAQIGGKWYSKAENSRAEHRIVAVWAPLPTVIESTSAKVHGDLLKMTEMWQEAGKISFSVKKLEEPVKMAKLPDRLQEGA